MITDTFIEKTVQTINRNKRVRRRLPGKGKINIERKLPYLLVYRYPSERVDTGTIRLVLGEASYMVASDNNEDGSLSLLRTIARKMADEFNSFLIIEIWSAKDEDSNTFIIKAPDKPAHSTIEELEQGLSAIRRLALPLEVKKENVNERHPPGMEPLLSIQETKETGCLLIGLEVPPVYRDQESQHIYPLFFRSFKREFSSAIKKAVFDFLRVQTKSDINNYQMLGSKNIESRIWHIDRKLAEIENSYEFLLLVTPIDSEKNWKEFKRNKFKKNPVFHYRLLPIDPDEYKRDLYNLNIDQIDDPSLAYLFRDKRNEVETQLTMLGERGTKSFMYNSIRLYHGVGEKLVKLALGILATVPIDEKEQGESVSAFGYKEAAQQEFEYYRKQYPAFDRQIIVRPDINGIMVSKGNLLIPRKMKMSAYRIDALVQHEVGTHVLTYVNGRAQPLKQLYGGLAGYDELQEGLAVLAEYLVGGLNASRMRLLAGRVVAAEMLMDGAEFVETFKKLHENYCFPAKTAYGITSRIYQGGGFIKDVIYLRGLMRLLHHLEKGGELEPLYIGKIAEKHIPIIKELQHRNVLRQAPLMPRFLPTEEAQNKLQEIRKGIIVTNMVEKEIV